MMSKTTVKFGIVVTALVTMAACQIEFDGSSPPGGVSFSDQTPALDAEGSQRPLALGATMNLHVGSSAPGEAIQVRSSDPSVLKVTQTGGSITQVKGVGVGRATLLAIDGEGQEGSLEIEVAPIADTIIHVLPWNAFAALPEELFIAGVAILPESPVAIFPQHLDERGRTLTGFGGSPWRVDGDPEATIAPDPNSDFATLRSALAGRTLTISNALGEVEIEVVEEAAVQNIAFREFFIEEINGVDAGQTLTLSQGQLTLFHLVANLADGRYVVGGGSAPMTVALSEGPTDPIKVFSSAEVEDDNADLQRIMNNARAFGLEAVEPGDATVTVSWLGHIEAFTVVVR